MVGDIDSERGYAYLGAGLMGESITSIQFSCELKTALKTKIFF